MSEVRKVILSNEIKMQLLEKHNKSCNCNYQLHDIEHMVEYECNSRKIILIEVIFKDFIKQRFVKSTMEIDNFI